DKEDAPRINPRTEDDWPGLGASPNEQTASSASLSGARRSSWIWVALGLCVVAPVLILVVLNLLNGNDNPIGDGTAAETDPKVNPVPIKADPNTTSQWVLSAGGSVTIRVGAGDRELKSSKDALPEVFQLKRVNLTGRPITDRELGYLNNLPDLDY